VPVLVACGLVMSACLTTAPRGYPLYEGPVRNPDAVATLRGPIASIDTRDVRALGQSFELPAGCHVVTTRTDVFETDSTQQGYIQGTGPPLVFAFHMRRGHVYAIERVSQAVGSPTRAAVWMRARDAAPDGRTIDVQPVRKAIEVRGCGSENKNDEDPPDSL